MDPLKRKAHLKSNAAGIMAAAVPIKTPSIGLREFQGSVGPEGKSRQANPMKASTKAIPNQAAVTGRYHPGFPVPKATTQAIRAAG